jgi:hypothetical protein
MYLRNGILGEIERRMNEGFSAPNDSFRAVASRGLFFGKLSGFVAEPHRESKYRLSLNRSDNVG